jgi:hypothetical protein
VPLRPPCIARFAANSQCSPVPVLQTHHTDKGGARRGLTFGTATANFSPITSGTEAAWLAGCSGRNRSEPALCQGVHDLSPRKVRHFWAQFAAEKFRAVPRVRVPSAPPRSLSLSGFSARILRRFRRVLLPPLISYEGAILSACLANGANARHRRRGARRIHRESRHGGESDCPCQARGLVVRPREIYGERRFPG